jgi:hypothetical protein
MTIDALKTPPLHTKSSPIVEDPMLDGIMLALALGFFALSIGYTIACDRL